MRLADGNLLHSEVSCMVTASYRDDDAPERLSATYQEGSRQERAGDARHQCETHKDTKGGHT